jgi:lipopolysaccharide/colanic/teichoic acid biosynthesis glycosyltransferase
MSAAQRNGLAVNSAVFPTTANVRRIDGCLKRTFDLAIAGFGLILAAPLFLIIAALIKLDSPGPVFFLQERVGLRRRRFLMWKFRKMHNRLSKPGPSLTKRHDPRLTTIGRFLERTKLDELPQLLNVIWGDMSIVGPRPEVPKFIEQYPDRWEVVLSVKPGIFGPNQLRYRNESELYPPGCENVEAYYIDHILPAKLDFDAEYARSIGVVQDLAILVRCAAVTLFGTITRDTLSVRRWQMLNLFILSILGVCGMVAANRIAGDRQGDDLFYCIVLAAVAKPVCLVTFKVAQALATSMTADDFQRIWWCAITSAALIITGMLFLNRRDFSRLMLLLDTSLFLSVLLMYKLLLFKAYVRLYLHGSDELSRRLVYLSLVISPLSLFGVVTFRHGMEAWSGANLSLYLTLFLLVTIVRPLVILLSTMRHRPAATGWVTWYGTKLALGALIGSAVIASASVLVNERGVGRGDLLFDFACYLAGMTCAAVWQQGRLNEGRRGGLSAARGGSPAAEPILVVGSGIELSCFVAALAELPGYACKIVGIVTPNLHHRTSTVGGYPIIGHIQDIPELLDTTDISRVVVVTCGVDQASLRELTRQCRGREDRFAFVEMLATLRLRPDSHAHAGQSRLPHRKDHGNLGGCADRFTVG